MKINWKSVFFGFQAKLESTKPAAKKGKRRTMKSDKKDMMTDLSVFQQVFFTTPLIPGKGTYPFTNLNVNWNINYFCNEQERLSIDVLYLSYDLFKFTPCLLKKNRCILSSLFRYYLVLNLNLFYYLIWCLFWIDQYSLTTVYLFVLLAHNKNSLLFSAGSCSSTIRQRSIQDDQHPHREQDAARSNANHSIDSEFQI